MLEAAGLEIVPRVSEAAKAEVSALAAGVLEDVEGALEVSAQAARVLEDVGGTPELSALAVGVLEDVGRVPAVMEAAGLEIVQRVSEVGAAVLVRRTREDIPGGVASASGSFSESNENSERNSSIR